MVTAIAVSIYFVVLGLVKSSGQDRARLTIYDIVSHIWFAAAFVIWSLKP